MKRASFTHLDKVFWPREGYSKGDVIRYYDRAAEFILPYLRGKPLVLLRHPNGIRGESFFQKNIDPRRLPDSRSSVAIRARSTGRMVHYVVCNSKTTLLYLANLGCIEFHPWFSKVRNIRRPGFMVIDLDPGRRNTFDQVVAVARAVRKVIEEAGGTCFVKTSGKRGIHVCVPLRPIHDFTDVRAAARLIVRVVNRRLPKLTSLARSPANRTNRVYLDYARNSYGQTIVAPYSLRAYPAAPVSTPLEWRELTSSLRPARYNMKTIFRRLHGKGDIWRKAMRGGVNLLRLAARLNRMLNESRERRKETKLSQRVMRKFHRRSSH